MFLHEVEYHDGTLDKCWLQFFTSLKLVTDFVSQEIGATQDSKFEILYTKIILMKEDMNS